MESFFSGYISGIAVLFTSTTVPPPIPLPLCQQSLSASIIWNLSSPEYVPPAIHWWCTYLIPSYTTMSLSALHFICHLSHIPMTVEETNDATFLLVLRLLLVYILNVSFSSGFKHKACLVTQKHVKFPQSTEFWKYNSEKPFQLKSQTDFKWCYLFIFLNISAASIIMKDFVLQFFSNLKPKEHERSLHWQVCSNSFNMLLVSLQSSAKPLWHQCHHSA